MLSERVKEWTREWQQEGFQKGIEKARAALTRQLEKRFGPLPREAQQHIESLDHEAIVEMSVRLSTTPSLEALGLS